MESVAKFSKATITAPAHSPERFNAITEIEEIAYTVSCPPPAKDHEDVEKSLDRVIPTKQLRYQKEAENGGLESSPEEADAVEGSASLAQANSSTMEPPLAISW